MRGKGLGLLGSVPVLLGLALVACGCGPDPVPEEEKPWVPFPGARWRVVWWPVTWLREYDHTSSTFTFFDGSQVFDSPGLGEFVQSPDGRRSAISQGEWSGAWSWSVHVSGQSSKIEPVYALEIARGSLQFSPDNKRVAFTALLRNWVAVGNGERGPEFAQIIGLTYSPDSKHLLYFAFDGHEWRAVVDGKPGTGFADVDGRKFTFSNDGRRFAYGARTDKGWVLVLDDTAGPLSDLMPEHATFSPDSKRVAYTATRNGSEMLMLDGKAGPGFDSVGPPLFSPDSRRIAYAVRKGKSAHCVVDGQFGPAWDDCSHLAFSSDSARVAYLAVKDGNTRLVLDGQVEAEFERATAVWFAEGSAWPSYVARVDGKWRVFLDGMPAAEYSDPGNRATCYYGASTEEKGSRTTGIGAMPVVFSWDGKRVASLVKRRFVNGVDRGGEAGLFVSVDGKEGPEMLWVDPGSIRFSPDSEHIVYSGHMRHEPLLFSDYRTPLRVVVDGEPGLPLEVLYNQRPVFRPDGTIQYLGSKREAVVSVRHSFINPGGRNQCSKPPK